MRTPAFLVVLAVLAPLATATLTDPIQDDARSGGDAGDAPDEATPLTSRTRDGRPPTAEGAHTGFAIIVDDPVDWYSFVLGDDASGTNGPGRIDLRVLGRSPTCAAPSLPVDTAMMEATLVAPTGESYKLDPGSPCGYDRALVVMDAHPGEWRLQLRVDAPHLPEAVGGFASGPGTEGGPPTVATDYVLVLGCEPRC